MQQEILVPVDLRVSLTKQCQLRCRYCRPAGYQPAPTGLADPWTVWHRRLRAFVDAMPVSKIRFTGGEPLLYRDLIKLVAACAAHGGPELALTTNGLRLAGLAQALREAGLNRVNVSLDALDSDCFRAMTGARPGPVIEGIDSALKAGLAVKLNAVILRGLNDGEMIPLLRFAAARNVPIRFLEMMPMGPAAAEFTQRYLSGAEMKQRLGESVRFDPLPYSEGETSRDFRAVFHDGTEAVCGFILPTSTPFCTGCRRLRLSSEGRLLGCLAQPDAVAVEEAVAAMERGDPAPLRSLVAQALSIKSRAQRFRDQPSMMEVGG